MITAKLFLRASVCFGVCQLVAAITHYDGTACCNLALQEKAFLNKSTSPTRLEDYICGQQFNASIKPAPELLVSYTYCSTRCSGWGLSKGTTPSEWAAPLVQFILPSVLFSMVVPRQQKIEFSRLLSIKFGTARQPRWFFSAINLGISLFMSTILLPMLVVLDNVVWIIMIFSGAGSMLIGGLYEALVDFRIVRHVRSQRLSGGPLSTQYKLQLLIALVSGNLVLDIGKPQALLFRKLGIAEEHDRFAKVEDCERRNEQIKTRLLSMNSTQLSFGSAVGAPVLFYLGQFVYTILDLLSRRGDQDAAISLAFGVEWMVIVHVAIISGCLLASNNPSMATAIVGLAPDDPTPFLCRAPTLLPPNGISGSRMRRFKLWLGLEREMHRIRHLPTFSPAYETRFQPVWLWDRGSNKVRWIHCSEEFQTDQSVKDCFKFTLLDWVFYIILPTSVLIILPPVAGGVVAYKTPPVGFSCRSLSFVSYGFVQAFLMIIALMRYGFEGREIWEGHPSLRKFCRNMAFWFSVLLTCMSAFTSIGGTLMQVMGVYRNCFCYVLSNYWWDILWYNQDRSPGIFVSTDTLKQRNSSQNWVIMGSVATSFMALACYVGYWYQRLLRKRFIEEVESLFQEPTKLKNSLQIPEHDDSDDQSAQHLLTTPNISTAALANNGSTSSYMCADPATAASRPRRESLWKTSQVIVPESDFGRTFELDELTCPSPT